MKTLHFLAMLLIAALILPSCKDEEEGTPRQTTETYTYSDNLRGSEGVKGELDLSELKLADIIGTEPANNLEKAEMQLADSHLEISGLNQIESPDTVAVVLENFTIEVGARQGVNLGDCSTDPQGTDEFAADAEQSTNEIVDLIQDIFTDVTSGSKRANITVTFTPNTDISSSDNVQLEITIGGTYHYEEFE